jgi:hypothetical protein
MSRKGGAFAGNPGAFPGHLRRVLRLHQGSGDSTIADVPSGTRYTGALNDSGETLRLIDSTGAVVDSANADGGGWTAAGGPGKTSMQRRGGDDQPGNWMGFPGAAGSGVLA